MEMDLLVTFLQAHKLRLVTAESCIAGLIASTVADVEEPVTFWTAPSSRIRRGRSRSAWVCELRRSKSSD